MGRRTFSIMFMIRRARKLKNQEFPIYMRITVDGERAEISIKRSVNSAYWNVVRLSGFCNKQLPLIVSRFGRYVKVDGSR